MKENNPRALPSVESKKYNILVIKTAILFSLEHYLYISQRQFLDFLSLL